MRLPFISRRLAGWLLLLVGASACAGWWYHSTRPAQRLRRGLEAARRDDLVEAEQYVSLLEGNGARDQASLLSAEIAIRRNDPSSALTQLRKIKDGGPLSRQVGLLMARCLIALRHQYDAEAALRSFLEKWPDDADGHRWLATIYYDQGDYILALKHLRRVAELEPTDSRPYRLLGLVSKDLADMDNKDPAKFADAVEAYHEALRLAPHSADAAEVRLELAECLTRQDKPAEVLQVLDGMETAAAAELRADALLALGRPAESAQVLDQAIGKNPTHPGLLRRRADQQAAAGNHLAAAALLERADPNDRDHRIHFQLALAYEALGRKKESDAQLKIGEEIKSLREEITMRSHEVMNNPWDPFPRQRLADCWQRLNQPDMARMWQRAADACEGMRR